MIAVLNRKIRTALRQRPLFYLLLIPAWILLGVSRFVIVTFSFKTFARWLGAHDGLAPRTPVTTNAEEKIARDVRDVVAVASKYTPWISNCFPQAVTAHVMLKLYRVPHAMFFGLRRVRNADAHGDIMAHAWVVSGPVNVSGGRSFGLFTSVGCFVSLRAE